MSLDFAKLKNKFRWQTAIIIAGGFILLAEIILLAIFLVVYLASGNAAKLNSDKDKTHNVVVPQVSTVKKSPFSPEDFVYDGDYMTCLSKPAELGVDVSYYQGDIDWKQVKDAGFTFAIIRVGGRGYGEGGLYEDTLAKQNYEGAKAAGLKVGAYFFSQAITEMEAREEAWYALELTSGWELDLPLVYDWEYISDDARTGGMDEAEKARVTKAFFEVIESVGKTPMAYVTPWAGEEYMRVVQDYPVWVVQYSEPMDFPYNFNYWQYTCTGTVPGIEGNVDINLYIP